VEAHRTVRHRGSHISTQWSHRWRWGCQPYAPIGRPLPQGKYLVLISVRVWFCRLRWNVFTRRFGNNEFPQSYMYVPGVSETICFRQMKRSPPHLIGVRPNPFCSDDTPFLFHQIPTGRPVLSATRRFKPVAILFKNFTFRERFRKEDSVVMKHLYYMNALTSHFQPRSLKSGIIYCWYFFPFRLSDIWNEARSNFVI
jgi:hypothetical protein